MNKLEKKLKRKRHERKVKVKQRKRETSHWFSLLTEEIFE